MKRCIWSAIFYSHFLTGCGIDPAADGPPAGNPSGTCPVPAEAQAEDTSRPDFVIGDGTPESCTGDAFISAVLAGGVLTFNCGPQLITIPLNQPAMVPSHHQRLVIDGGGKVALSGQNLTRILYVNTCDPWLASLKTDCLGQQTPDVTLQNLTFVRGHVKDISPGGGGAVFASGGRLKVVNCRFFQNTGLDSVGAFGESGDGGGGAIEVTNQFNDLPVYIVNSTFGGKPGLGNEGTTGGALGGFGVSVTILNSVLSDNRALHYGRVFGGGGAVFVFNFDEKLAVNLCGVTMTGNAAAASGGAVFFASGSSDESGTLTITDSVFRNNDDGLYAGEYPGIDAISHVIVQSSTIE